MLKMSMSHSIVVLVLGALSRLRLGVGDPLEVLVITEPQWDMWLSSTDMRSNNRDSFSWRKLSRTSLYLSGSD